MKTFKKIGALLVGFVALAAPVQAEEWKVLSFLSVPSITVSNTFAGATNLALQAGGTNMNGLQFTNNNGNRIIVGTSTNRDGTYAGASQPVIGFVPVSPKSVPFVAPINSTPWTNYQGPVVLSIRGVGGSGADTAMTITFSAMQGTNRMTAGGNSTWSALFVPASGAFALRTNVPMTFFAGATAIQCDTITTGDTDASSQVTITDLDLTQIW